MKHLMKAKQMGRFADGGEVDKDVEAANASDDPIRELNRRKGWTADAEASPVKDAPEVKPRNLDSEPKKQSFSQAFRAAKDGSTFEWNGKKYKKEYAKAPSKTRASTPPPAESARGMGRAAVADNNRAGASKAMADKAALEAQQRRGASEARAKAAREVSSEAGVGSLAQQRAAGASTRSEAMERAKENQRRRDMMMGREPERAPGYKNGGLVKRQAAKNHGKAC